MKAGAGLRISQEAPLGLQRHQGSSQEGPTPTDPTPLPQAEPVPEVPEAPGLDVTPATVLPIMLPATAAAAGVTVAAAGFSAAAASSSPDSLPCETGSGAGAAAAAVGVAGGAAAAVALGSSPVEPIKPATDRAVTDAGAADAGYRTGKGEEDTCPGSSVKSPTGLARLASADVDPSAQKYSAGGSFVHFDAAVAGDGSPAAIPSWRPAPGARRNLMMNTVQIHELLDEVCF